ncbi:hypothetical protein ROZALSC1DRAFT_28088 [Rozella allomycis CSF55]|uniref:Uncharacterized protein n=1 Tax=Rozella allomycis (strain CSF55) TaxID=988480 RepID=A0A4V1J059_ROZAC|nr:hypothetical protein ROZALSC1DRAFT_28088 [Rozella allomycis CSF55]
MSQQQSFFDDSSSHSSTLQSWVFSDDDVQFQNNVAQQALDDFEEEYENGSSLLCLKSSYTEQAPLSPYVSRIPKLNQQNNYSPLENVLFCSKLSQDDFFNSKTPSKTLEGPDVYLRIGEKFNFPHKDIEEYFDRLTNGDGFTIDYFAILTNSEGDVTLCPYVSDVSWFELLSALNSKTEMCLWCRLPIGLAEENLKFSCSVFSTFGLFYFVPGNMKGRPVPSIFDFLPFNLTSSAPVMEVCDLKATIIFDNVKSYYNNRGEEIICKDGEEEEIIVNDYPLEAQITSNDMNLETIDQKYEEIWPQILELALPKLNSQQECFSSCNDAVSTTTGGTLSFKSLSSVENTKLVELITEKRPSPHLQPESKQVMRPFKSARPITETLKETPTKSILTKNVLRPLKSAYPRVLSAINTENRPGTGQSGIINFDGKSSYQNSKNNDEGARQPGGKLSRSAWSTRSQKEDKKEDALNLDTIKGVSMKITDKLATSFSKPKRTVSFQNH